MKYVPNTTSNQTGLQNQGSNSDTSFYARVERVISKPEDDGYLENGGIKSLNGVFFTLLENKSGASQEPSEDLKFAYPTTLSLFHIPIRGEVVRVTAVPTPDISSMTLVRKYYYDTVINYWNSPKDGLFFDLYKPLIIDQDHRQYKVNPILSLEGDTMIQGRYGQVLKYSKQGDGINPTVYLTTARQFKDPINTPVSTDINTDLSSIEFHSNGVSNLKTSNGFSKSHRKEQAPQTSDTYQGEQILLNTGRVVLNTKEDSVLVSSKKSISTSSETLNQEATKEICFDSPKIFLGEKSMNTTTPEPVLLGNKVEEYLIELIDQLIEVADSLKIATTVSGEQIPVVNQKGAKVGVVLKSLKSRLNPKGSSDYKSKKTFVE
jgi:hypothetical protein